MAVLPPGHALATVMLVNIAALLVVWMGATRGGPVGVQTEGSGAAWSVFGNLSVVMDPLAGTNGGVYSTSGVVDHYGEYNYCNMPHVRPGLYVVPPSDHRLKYVEVVHRHHKRTPYQLNTFPREDVALQCGDVTEFHYAGTDPDHNSPGSLVAVPPVGWQVYHDAANPMVATGFNGTCRFPMITAEGLRDAAQHGRDLYAVYHTLLGFLPERYNASEVVYRVTLNVITLQVVGLVIGAMFPNHTDQVSVLLQAPSTDSLEPAYACKAADQLKAAVRQEPEWMYHLELAKPLLAQLDAISGVDPASDEWHSLLDHYFDNLSSRSCHQIPYPCSVVDRLQCVTPAMAEQVFRLGDYEYNYQWTAARQLQQYLAYRYGAWLAELRLRIAALGLAQPAATVSGVLASVKYRHNVAHDGSVAPLLGALEAAYLRWPGMGAEVVFEVWEKQGRDYVRVLYGGEVLQTRGVLGAVDMVDAAVFLEFLGNTSLVVGGC